MANKLIKLSIALLPFLLIFIASLYSTSDPDLGWHLKYGEYFFKHHQILKDNTFSTDMPDYKWVNSSWATDLLTYSAFESLGFLGITLLGALTTTLIFFFLSKAANLSIWQQTILFPVLLYLEAPFFMVSFRGQLLSLLFLSMEVFILSKLNKLKSKHFLLFIPLFLVWSNFHGEFILGLGVFALWIFFHMLREWFESEKEDRLTNFSKTFIKLAPIFLISILATLVNPFGVGIYKETLSHFGNPWQQYIAEWLPFADFSNLWWNNLLFGFFIFYAAIFLFFSPQFKKQLPNIGLLIVIFSFSLLMRRYAWPAYILGLPILAPAVSSLKPSNQKFYQVTLFFIYGLLLYFIISSKLPINQFQKFSWQDYCTIYQFCSSQGSQFLVDNNLKDNLMTTYDWGGYLIWNFPQIKPSIDGRMHLWTDEKGYSAFAYYYPYEQNWKDIDDSKYDKVFTSKGKPVYSRLVQLTQQGKWRLVYQDKYSGIFMKNINK